jgi:uncharacterized DUF497 family protein
MLDEQHSQDEERWLILGRSVNEILLLVVHIFRNTDEVEFVRIISARKATKKEYNTYRQRCLK